MAKQELIDEGTDFHTISKEELEFFLENFITYKQLRRRIKSKKVAKRRKERNARKDKRDFITDIKRKEHSYS